MAKEGLPGLDEAISAGDLYTPQEFEREVSANFAVQSSGGWLWSPRTLTTHPEFGINAEAQENVETLHKVVNWNRELSREADSALASLGEVYLLLFNELDWNERLLGRLDHFIGTALVNEVSRTEMAVEGKSDRLYKATSDGLIHILVDIDVMVPEQTQAEKDNMVRTFGLEAFLFTHS